MKFNLWETSRSGCHIHSADCQNLGESRAHQPPAALRNSGEGIRVHLQHFWIHDEQVKYVVVNIESSQAKGGRKSMGDAGWAASFKVVRGRACECD